MNDHCPGDQAAQVDGARLGFTSFPEPSRLGALRENRTIKIHEDKVKKAARAKVYYAAHQEERRAYSKKYWAEHREARNEYDRKRYSSDPDKFRKKTREYQLKNREHVLIVKRIHYHNNAERQRERNLKRHYGLTIKDFDVLLQKQGGRCAICKSDHWGTHGPHVDHCHRTGRVRGILCGNCNRAIGCIHDDPALTASLGQYLLSRQTS